MDTKVSEDDPLPLEFGTAEIDDEPDAEGCDPEIVQHLTALMVGDAIDDFGVYDNGVLHDQIGHKLRNPLTLVHHREPPLLITPDATEPELDDQGVLVGMFVQTVSNPAQNLDRAADDRVHKLTV